MSKSNAMPSLDTLFGGAETSDDQITTIDDSLIDEFPGHPYRLYTGKRHTDLLESVKEFGVLTPVILRAEENGRYTLLSGYNRRHCNQLAGNSELPAVVMHNISDGDAKLIITHSNRQRGLDELLPSEKAFAFKMELEGLKETRRELKKVEAIEVLENAANADEQEVSGDLFQLEQMDYSRDQLAQSYGLSSVEIFRFIRLTCLCHSLLDLVDENKVALRAAVPLTYLSEEMQLAVWKLVSEKGYKVDIHKAELLKMRYKGGALDADMVESVLSGKETAAQAKPKSTPIKIKLAVVKRYFTKGESQKDIQQTIEKALELYFSKKEEASATAPQT